MKAINLFLFLAILTFGACDMSPKEAGETDDLTAVDTTAQVDPVSIEITAPANYVQYFDQAIAALEQGDRVATLTYLQTGIDALTQEGQALEGDAKHKMDTAIADLEAAKLQLQSGQLQAANDLKQLFFQVQVNTPHPLMADAPAETGVQE
ncbi:MAG: hypothetical protein R2824_33275 [Saprospiraceae bacterium]|nr:hypothetical protein [Lewinella sp.]